MIQLCWLRKCLAKITVLRSVSKGSPSESTAQSQLTFSSSSSETTRLAEEGASLDGARLFGSRNRQISGLEFVFDCHETMFLYHFFNFVTKLFAKKLLC